MIYNIHVYHIHDAVKLFFPFFFLAVKGILKTFVLQALKFSPVNKIHIFLCMGKVFCVEFQKVPFKFHTKYLIEGYNFYTMLSC